jgi:hypothetical protein
MINNIQLAKRRLMKSAFEDIYNVAMRGATWKRVGSKIIEQDPFAAPASRIAAILVKKGFRLKSHAFWQWKQLLDGYRNGIGRGANTLETLLRTRDAKSMMRALMVWHEDLNLMKMRKKMIALWKFIHVGEVMTQGMMFRAYEKWKNAKSENPWFKKALIQISKNSKIGTQVAFWRLLPAGKVDAQAQGKCKTIQLRKRFKQ